MTEEKKNEVLQINCLPPTYSSCFYSQSAPTWKMVIQTPSNLNMPVALAFDWLAGNLYWITEDGQLSVSDREGQAIRKFNFTESATESGLVYNATHIVLDPTNQAMYTSRMLPAYYDVTTPLRLNHRFLYILLRRLRRGQAVVRYRAARHGRTRELEADLPRLLLLPLHPPLVGARS